jgi:hypothetical protein
MVISMPTQKDVKLKDYFNRSYAEAAIVTHDFPRETKCISYVRQDQVTYV